MKDKGHQATDKILEGLQNELVEMYTQAYKDVEQAYLKNNKLLEDMARASSSPEELQRLLRRNKRLETLLQSIANDIKNANVTATKMINDTMLNVYDLNFDYGAFLVEMESQMEVYVNLYNVNAIKKLIGDNINPFTEIKLEEWLDVDQVHRELKRTFLAEIVKGSSIQGIAKAIEHVINKTLNEAIRVARTETTRIESMARQEAFEKGEEMGIEMEKVWLCTSDSRTRDSHLAMMNQKRPLKEPFSNGLMYPGGLGGSASQVINCRCTHVVEIKGVEKSAGLKELDEENSRLAFEEWQRRKNGGKKK